MDAKHPLLAPFQQGDRIAHAHALISEDITHVQMLAKQLASLLLCVSSHPPCLQCKSCTLNASDKHPDAHSVMADKEGGSIKVDQIREIQPLLYTSPQLGHHRVVIIYQAQRMNIAAANALLKVLEEPPEGVYFLLCIQNTSTLPLTILSRCQIHRIALSESLTQNYLQWPQWAMTEAYAPFTERALERMDEFLSYLDGEMTLFELTQRWRAFDFRATLTFLYRFTAEAIASRLMTRPAQPHDKALQRFALRFGIYDLFEQMNQLQQMFQLLNQRTPMNETLALEQCLLRY